MNIKEFLKPNLIKIIFSILIFLLLPVYGWQNFICGPCPTVDNCPPCGDDQLKIFGGYNFIKNYLTNEADYPSFEFNYLSIVLNIILSYILSSLILYSINYYKRW